MKKYDLSVLGIDCKLVFELLTRFIKNEVEKTGMNKVLLGLSGGVDSALVAFICKEALGAKNVLGVRMPYKTSSSESLEHAELVAKTCGIDYITCDITGAVEGFVNGEVSLGAKCANFFDRAKLDANFAMEKIVNRHSMGNIMARMRMLNLYHLSAASGAMVVGTSNKTELLLGYGTLHGDMACGINPVGDLYKRQLRELSAYMGVPRVVLAKKPSADLFPGQTDEGDLGFSYDELDYALYRIVDCRENPKLIVESGEVEARLAEFCVRRITSMQFKRQMPLIALLSFRTINQSFNYPRDWAL